ncbi:hypothetical protein ON010_g17703 [Phytophthora cinnamomi]|nr:hypothetical protein ON010_g17703 [Phytophthora cinnamomi]
MTPPHTGNSDRARSTSDDSKTYRSTRSSSRRSKSRRYQSTDDSSDEDVDFTGDGGAEMGEYLHQIHEVPEFKLLNATPGSKWQHLDHWGRSKGSRAPGTRAKSRCNGFASSSTR